MPREGCIGGVLIEAAAGGSSVEAKKAGSRGESQARRGGGTGDRPAAKLLSAFRQEFWGPSVTSIVEQCCFARFPNLSGDGHDSLLTGGRADV